MAIYPKIGSAWVQISTVPVVVQLKGGAIEVYSSPTQPQSADTGIVYAGTFPIEIRINGTLWARSAGGGTAVTIITQPGIA
jgi:hypothetical protein